MSRTILARPLTREAFAPFGEVLDTEGTQHFPINGGMCERHHALATVETAGGDASAILSIFRGRPYPFPLELTLVEHHPLGSQAFMPLGGKPFLVVVCPDENGLPGRPQAFVTAPGQGVNYRRGIWHGVLTPIGEPQDFLVADRAGPGNNLVEFTFGEPWRIELPNGA